MKNSIKLFSALTLGIIGGALIVPINAQSVADSSSCQVGDNSAAACVGKWIYFAGNTSGVDSGAWVIRMDGETGEVWYKNGKRMILAEEPN